MSNTNSKNLDNCYSCYSCNSCNSCNSCDFCGSCDSCDSCYSCNSCNSCDSCDFCDFCDFCGSCDSCYSCNSCDFCDSCYASSDLRMSERMIFCIGDGKYEKKGEGYQKNNRIFNVQVTPEEWDTARSSLPAMNIGLTKWVDKKDMTDQEKNSRSGWETMGGFLKRFEYKEAWKTWWSEAAESDRQKILDLPHFNQEIFEKITGIKADHKVTPPEEIE